ncbi:hypothetical protein ABIA30_003601 [Mycobacterium sp. MAA66]
MTYGYPLKGSGTMPDISDQLVGATVYDAAGDKIGRIRQLYLTSLSRRPKWATVRTGPFGVWKLLVPLTGARYDGRDSVRVPVAKSRVKSAPHFDGGAQIAPEEDERLMRHYGFPLETSGPPQSATQQPAPGKHAAALAAAAAAGIGGTASNTSARTSPLTPSEESPVRDSPGPS